MRFDVNKTGGQILNLEDEFETQDEPKQIKRIVEVKLYPGRQLPADA